MNSNATLKIPDQESGDADLKEFQRTKPKDSKPENKTGKPDIWQESFFQKLQTFEHESLILAQDERWRRA